MTGYLMKHLATWLFRVPIRSCYHSSEVEKSPVFFVDMENKWCVTDTESFTYLLFCLLCESDFTHE